MNFAKGRVLSGDDVAKLKAAGVSSIVAARLDPDDMHEDEAAATLAKTLAGEGIEVEVIDLRSLFPYDFAAIKESVGRTNRLAVVNEDTEVTNFGEHLVRRTVEELFYELLAPPRLLAGKFVPGIGLADPLEMASVPQLNDIAAAMRAVAAEAP